MLSSQARETKQYQTDFSLEDQYDGPVFGLDEVGRAPLAGSVTAACVYVPDNIKDNPIWGAITDSKKLSAKKREYISDYILDTCPHAISTATAREIEDINIYYASLLAMQRSYATMIADFGVVPFAALIDGKAAPNLPCKSQTVIKGDSVSLSIAAASIIAKVHRDKYMSDLAKEYPYYGWENNAGYPTKHHIEGIKKHGITSYHRKTFGIVRDYLSPSENTLFLK